MPILLWPFPSGAPTPPPPFPIVLSGKVLIIDASPSIAEHPIYVLGKSPNLGESCALVFVVGPGMQGGQVLFTFTRPDGTFYPGIPTSSFIGGVTVGQILIPQFPAGQYAVYLFGLGELSQRGTWQISLIAPYFFSNTYNFTVV